ncbi:hypothetical protein GCM10029963_79220 [Micromonospora andamanensis]
MDPPATDPGRLGRPAHGQPRRPGAPRPEGVADSGRRLRPSLADVDRPDPDHFGVLIGTTVAGGMPLRQSWEDMAIDIWGPRTGKTTSRAIPAIVAAPGPTLVTSVKGDIVDATREIRAARGAVWAFDPQHILGTEQNMWWNPLRAVATITDARRLAEHFAAAEREPGVSRDAFFDPSSEELVANLLLAAAVSGRDILAAYRWAVSPRDDEPAMLLREHGFDLPADAVSGVVNMPDKTRGGIYAGAQKMLMCLTEPAVTRWVTPPTRGGVLEFDPAAFVTSTDVLYLLSQGGPGSPAPLVAALTDAVLRAGELQARASAGRRLDPPLLSILDEAANICRLRQLPNLYSYYGSHGLPIITILQSYPQGVDVWGREGMRKLWSAANVRTYGGGVADPDWLEELSKLIGEHDVTTRSTSSSGTGWGQRSVSTPPAASGSSTYPTYTPYLAAEWSSTPPEHHPRSPAPPPGRTDLTPPRSAPRSLAGIPPAAPTGPSPPTPRRSRHHDHTVVRTG